MVTTSARASSSSRSTRFAPRSAARSAVRFWLQAITSMLERRADRATCAPRLPRPSEAERLAAELGPDVVCQPPSRSARSSRGICRTARGSAPRPARRSARQRRACRRRHAALARGLEVDRGVAHAGGDEEPQVGSCSSSVARERRALAHRHDDLEVRSRRTIAPCPRDGRGMNRPHNLRRESQSAISCATP